MLRVGLIGCGAIGRAHAQSYQALHQLARVVVCCDEREAAASEAAQGIAGATVAADWRSVIERDDVDAVDICMPHHLHAPIVFGAAEAGKHILLEKPMAMNLAEARAMVEASDRAGRTLMVAQNQRFLDHHVRVKALLDDGVIGRVFAVRTDGNQFLSRMYPVGHWLYHKATAGGGITRTVAIHKIDLLRYFFGEIRRVACFQSITGLNPGMDCDDVATFLLEFESGVVGEGFFTFAAHKAPIPAASYEFFAIYGEKGLIHNVQNWYVYSTDVAKYSGGLTRLDWGPPDYSGSITEEIRHFLECAQTGAEPLTSGRDNLKTMAVVDALYQSAETRQVVEVAS